MSSKNKRVRRLIFPKNIRSALISFSIRSFGLLLLIVFLSVGLALLSHNILDPSWNVATSFATQNLMGPIGAYISDILLQTIGLSSYLVVLIFTIRSINTIIKGDSAYTNNAYGIDIVCGVLAIIPCSVILAGTTFSTLPNGAGGILGSSVYQLLGKYVSAGNTLSDSENTFAIGSMRIVSFINYALTIGLFFIAVNIKFNRILSLFVKFSQFVLKMLGKFILWLGLNLLELLVLTFHYCKKLALYLISLNSLKSKNNAFSKLLKSKVDMGKIDIPMPINEERKDVSKATKTEGGGSIESLFNKASSGMSNEVEQSNHSIIESQETDIEKKTETTVDKLNENSDLLMSTEIKEGNYSLPSLDLLEENYSKEKNVNRKVLQEGAIQLMKVLQEFGIGGEVSMIRPGPIITLYELIPKPGTKISRIISLSDDIARGMKALSIRIATVIGQDVIGFEIPNAEPQTVSLKEILESDNYVDSKSLSLPLALGQDIGGRPVIVDLAKMPHLLVAGTTGSGKSVAINAMILSLLYRHTPDKCKLVLIDPKMLELSVYDKIPHLLSPVVTDPKRAIKVLHWAVQEMESRYHKMSKMGVRNVVSYNMRINNRSNAEEHNSPVTPLNGEEGNQEPLPYIVIVVDEMADLMLVAGKEVEFAVQRLAQMARAAGIHIIMATQRPSVDVITGTLKANFPSRISFQVVSRIDSRTIINEHGAELLLGRGDMLFQSSGSRLTRLHSPFCSDNEVAAVVESLRSQGPPQYVEELITDKVISSMPIIAGDDEDENLYQQAVSIVLQEQRASTSYIQRKLKIGYNRAARLIEKLEDDGYVGPADRVGRREVIVQTE